jgi:hypothetical protein
MAADPVNSAAASLVIAMAAFPASAVITTRVEPPCAMADLCGVMRLAASGGGAPISAAAPVAAREGAC